MRSFASGFFAGTLILLVLPSLPDANAWVLAASLLLLLAGWYGRQQVWGRMLLGAVLGAAYALAVAGQVLAQRWPAAWEGRDIVLTGTVAEIPEWQEGGVVFRFAVKQPDYQGTLRLAWYGKTLLPIRAGERWQLQVRVKQPNGFQNPGGFDYEKWLFAQRISGTGYVREAVVNQRLAAAPWWSVNALRQQLQESIAVALDGSAATGLVQGLAVAYTEAITSLQWETLRHTGTIHLLAISGLHITMVAALGMLPAIGLWWLFPRLAIWLPRRVAAAVSGGLLATAYALLAGFNVPTQRTLLMVLVFMFSLLWRRYVPFSTAFSVALLLVLLLDPLAVLAVGFWLSFLTVGLLVWLGTRQWQAHKGWAVAVQVLLSLGTVPLTAGFFGMVSLISPVANLLAIPLVTFVATPLVLLGVAMAAVSDAAAAALWWLAGKVLLGLLAALEWLAALPWSHVYLPALPLPWLVLGLAGFVLLWLPRGMPGRWLGGLLMLPIFLYQPSRPAPGAFHLAVLDVGQGLAAVVRTANHTLVFDAGPKAADRFDTGELVLLPWLRAHGIRQVDALMVSHADLDHSGGAEALLRSLPVGQVWVGQAGMLGTYRPNLCQAGQQWEWDGVRFSVLHPSPHFRDAKDNNHSCVLKVSNGWHRVLLTADIEYPAEGWLVQHQAEALAADVLLVPHHGSKTSSSPRFLNTVRPRMAIVTHGYRNRFNHPHPNIVERYQARNINWFSTASSGELHLEFPSGPVMPALREWRRENPHFWQR